MSRASEWGLATLVMGGVLFLAAPIVMVLSAEMWVHANRSAHIVLLFAWLARLGVAAAVLCSIAAIGFGIKGIRLAKHDRQQSGLVVGGLVLSSASLIAWIIASIGLLSTTESLLRMYG